MQLRARDGRALLAGPADGVDADDREVDPHSLALGADLADALHEWARVADAVHRNGQTDESAAARLISRRGQQLAGRVAAAMGSPVSYADPLTGEITEVAVPSVPSVPDEPAEPAQESDPDRPAEPTPWATGLTVTAFSAAVVLLVVVALSLALGAASNWLALIANVVIALGLAPSVWLARRAPVWRWVAYGVVAGIVIAWIALLFTAL
ncbi:MAG TPA: DUF2537 domain-containing protein [Pseudonocardiaceae bacterium]|nr:DUF2537 domain-containing protein [Pseudonocardiaceae bacterium]